LRSHIILVDVIIMAMFAHFSKSFFLLLSMGIYLSGGNVLKDHCPEVPKIGENFNIFEILGPWYVVQYYSSSEEALTYHCMRTEFGLSNGNMDMKMRLTYKYAADPNEETQMGNITWQIPDPMRPEHWRHTEDHYKGVYNTDVVDTDHNSWLILLHCSDPESEKKFLSTFVLSRTPYMDSVTTNYLRDKVTAYDVNLDYLFPVNQTFCFGEVNYPHPDEEKTSSTSTTTSSPLAIIEEEGEEEEQEQELYVVKDGDGRNAEEVAELTNTVDMDRELISDNDEQE